jgi:hypothetical protein
LVAKTVNDGGTPRALFASFVTAGLLSAVFRETKNNQKLDYRRRWPARSIFELWIRRLSAMFRSVFHLFKRNNRTRRFSIE